MEEKRLQEYVRSYQQLLTEKGYDEHTLGKQHLAEPISASLEEALRAANEQSTGAEAVEIQFRIKGRILPEGDLIGFQFHFMLYPQTQTIDLKKIAVFDGQVLAVALTGNNSSFPSSRELYEAIKEQQAYQNPVRNKNNKPGKGPGLN